MATFSTVQAHHVLQAIAEYDERGAEQFRSVYRFEPVEGYAVVHEGREYDPRALLGVAHRFATGRTARQDEFSGGLGDVVSLLRRRGFEVREPVVAARIAPARATRASSGRSDSARGAQTTTRARTASSGTRAPARRPAVDDRPVALCPTCFMALPATGVCDQCN